MRRRIDDARPMTRGDCQGSTRPCPWMICDWHVIHIRSVDQGGPRSDEEITDDLSDEALGWETTCVLDVIDRDGEPTLQRIADVLGVSRQAVEQIEKRALRKLRLRHGPELLEALHELSSHRRPESQMARVMAAHQDGTTVGDVVTSRSYGVAPKKKNQTARQDAARARGVTSAARSKRAR